MEFGDYAPPAVPSPEQQRDALQKGLGRAVQWAAAGRLDEEILLAACLRDQRYDSQTDSPRGGWLWSMIVTLGAAGRLRVPILHALYDLADERNAYQLVDLAGRYAAAGDAEFRVRLYEIVEQRPFPDYCACLGDEEIVTLDGLEGFLFVARLRGRRLADQPWEWDDRSLVEFAVERLGEEEVRRSLDGTKDATLVRFRDGWRQALQADSPPRPGAHRERMRSKPVEEILREAEGDGGCFWFRGWGMHADEADLRTVAARLWEERRPRVLERLLRVFAGRPLPEFDARLLDLARHDDEKVRHVAMLALRQYQHPQVRAFAEAGLADGGDAAAVVRLFERNYRPGDEYRILDALRLPDDVDHLHGLLMDLSRVLEANPEADASHLGVLVYALTPCGNCRFHVTRRLVEQGTAPAWLREECRHDAAEDCRALVE